MIARKHILIGVGIVFLLFSVLNFFLMKSLESPPSKGKTSPVVNKAEKEIPGAARRKYPLVPEDPAKYGIVSVKESDLPTRAYQWDSYMKDILEESRILETPEGKTAMDKAKTTPEEFQNTMQRVDQQIVKFETQRKINPGDPEAEEQLKTLYKIKALGKVLQEKVTTLPAGQETPEQKEVQKMWLPAPVATK